LRRVFDRLLVWLCAFDVVASIAYFSGSWTIPKSPPTALVDAVGGEEFWNEMYPQAIGNVGTCTAQGFFALFGTWSTVLFTGCISVSFVLQVRYQFSEEQMKIPEKCFIGISLIIPIIGGIVAVIYNGMNPAMHQSCWIAPKPFQCVCNWPGLPESYAMEDYCGTTDYKDAYNVLLAFYGTLILTLIVIISSMVCLFWTVRTQELRTARWSEAARSGKVQKLVFIRTMLYTGAFLLVWIPTFISRFVAPGSSMYIQNIFIPLQGFLNVFIYANFKKHVVEERRKITTLSRVIF